MQKLISMILMLCLALSQAFTNILHTTNTPNNETLSNSLTQSNYPTTQSILLLTLNRNIHNTTTITKDIQTNALNANLSIDNRIFTNNGRNDIAQDITNFGKNTLIASYGASNTLYNTISTPFQALHNKDLSLKDTPTLWKLKQSQQATALTRNNDNLANNTINNLSLGQDGQDIQYALSLGISSKESPSKIYYNPNDDALGFHNTNKHSNTYNQNYLNAASGIINDTNAIIFTDAHERVHTYTHNETLANIAGKEAIKAWNIANRINGNKINTNASLNSLQWYNNQLSNPANYPNITDSKTLTPQSWYASQNPYVKSILESNTYNASLVNEVDRDNLGPAIIPPAISGGITAYRGYKAYKFAQGLNKSKDIIAKANPQSEEGKSGNHKENATNNERKQDAHKPGAPNIPNKKFDKRKGNQGYIDRESGNIYQRDRLHNRWEVYDKKGNHLGEVDNNGNPTKNPVPGRKIKP